MWGVIKEILVVIGAILTVLIVAQVIVLIFLQTWFGNIFDADTEIDRDELEK